MLSFDLLARWVGRDGKTVELEPALMRLLEAMHNLGSLRAASNSLHIPYRTLWSHLKAYEAQLGQSLASRHGRAGVLLTPFGLSLLQGHQLAQYELAELIGRGALRQGRGMRTQTTPQQFNQIAHH